MSLIDFASIADRSEKKKKQPEQFPFDHYFPQSVSFVGEPWEILSKHIGKLEQGAVINFWTFGRYAMHDIISYVCRQIGACSVSACTWAITEKAVSQVLARMKDGLITDFRLWIDPRVKVRNPIPLQMCQANFPVVIAPVHAKLCLFANDKWKISVSGSLNFTTNPQPERGIIQVIDSVYYRDLEVINGQFDRTAKE